MSSLPHLSEANPPSPALEVLRSPESDSSPFPPKTLPLTEKTTEPLALKHPGILRRCLGWCLGWCARNPLFLLTVALPTSLAFSYFGFLAPDLYVSESRFVIRSPQGKAPTGLGAILQGNTLSRSHDDTDTVHDFIGSRDALKALLEKFPLRTMYGDPKIFALSRFPGVDKDDSFEAFFKLYKNRILVTTDSSSSISVLSVRAFKAEDSHKINDALLEMGEKLINTLNFRARQDMIQFATAEVNTAEQRAKAAALALSAYRHEKQVFDPERQSAVQLQQISKLQEELINAKTQRALLESNSKESPQLQSINKRIEILSDEINNETVKIVGADSSLAQKAAEYERLSLDRAFAEKSLAVALASLETARNEAQRKQLYLERIVEPSLPDKSYEPARVQNTIGVLAFSLMAWSILSLLVAGVKEHHE